jgi:hypothetical protein
VGLSLTVLGVLLYKVPVESWVELVGNAREGNVGGSGKFAAEINFFAFLVTSCLGLYSAMALFNITAGAGGEK